MKLRTATTLGLETTLLSGQLKTVKVPLKNSVSLIEGKRYHFKTKSIP